MRLFPFYFLRAWEEQDMAERDILINTDDFPGNSNKSKQEIVKKTEKVIDGPVKRAKPSFFRKAAGVIFSDVNEEDLRSELIFDYLVPTIKDTIVDMGKMLLDAIFYGTTSVRKKSGGNKPYKVSYSDYYDKDKKPAQTKASSYNFDEITMTSRGDAEQVLDTLIDMTREYGQASVGDFCDVVGVDNNFTDYKYGWTDLTRTTISRTRDGYIINFPKPTKLD